MKPAVRQMRGPGMNKGLKKPRHGKFPKPETKKPASGTVSARSSESRNDYSKGPSYLSGSI
ncbi:MAG TPA: hypothetical protein VIG24_05245, partial [Acidimicrobiia bacterium]